jgi:uncharacterized integral membrane protein
MLLFVIGAVAAAVVIIFALQNATPITVAFLIWRFEGSLALVLLLTFALGVVVGALISIPAIMKRRRPGLEPPARR